MSHEQAFIADAARGGLRIQHLVFDKLARCKAEGDRGGKESGWYRFFPDGIAGGIWGNWKTGETGTWTAKDAARMTSSEQATHRARIEQARRERDAEQRQQWAKNRERNQSLWESAVPLTASDPVALYLARRGLPMPTAPALRYSPDQPYYEGGQLVGRFPAMLGALTDAGGCLVTVHRTFLTADGRKAAVPTPRKLMPASAPMAGASIKLGDPMPYKSGLALGIAEGIETALSVGVLYGLPCWSAVSAGGMEKAHIPAGVTSLFVMGDHDRSGVGQKAAESLARRAAALGITARACIPAPPGHDWNDELLGRRHTK